MLLIEKIIIGNDEKINLKIYMEKDFSVTVVNKKQKILFRQDTVQSYVVNEKQNCLVVIPSNEERLSQMNSLLDEVWIHEAYDLNNNHQQRSYHVTNNFIVAPAKLIGKVRVLLDDRLKSTVNHSKNLFESQQQFFQLQIADNEILSEISTEIELGGKKIISKTEILSIEDAIMPEQFRKFLDYTVSVIAA